MTTIKLLTSDESLAVVDNPLISSGDVKVVNVEIQFSDEWTGFAKSAVFFTDKDDTPYEQVLSGDACEIPHEVLASDGVLFIGVRGVGDNGEIKTTSLVRYRIVKGAPRGEGSSVDPTPGMYEQIIRSYGKMESLLDIERKRIDMMIADGDDPRELEFNGGVNVSSVSVWTNSAPSNNYTSHNLTLTLPEHTVGIRVAVKNDKTDSNATIFLDLYSNARASGIVKIGADYFYGERSFTLSGQTLTIGSFEYINDNLSNFSGTGNTLDIIDVNRTKVTDNSKMIPVSIHAITYTVSMTGEMVSDPELSDIRIGADGTIYDSAGEAVRTQIEKVDVTRSLYNVETETGFNIRDAITYPLQYLGVYGIGKQYGAPTPDSPQPIYVYENGFITFVSDNNRRVNIPYTLRAIGDTEYKDHLMLYADGTGQIIRRTKYVNLRGVTFQAESENGVIMAKRLLSDISDFDPAINSPYNISMFTHFSDPSASVNNPTAMIVNGELRVAFVSGSFGDVTNVTQLNAWFANHDNYLLYALAEPEVINLTESQVLALIGNIYMHETESVITNSTMSLFEVGYMVNVPKYVTRKLAHIEAMLLENISAI